MRVTSMKRLCKITIVLVCSVLFNSITHVSAQDYPSKNEIEKIIKREVNNKRSNSISIAILDKGKITYVNAGYPFDKRTDKASEHTIYEIASVSKIFTTTLLADFVIKDKIGLDDYMVDYLPDTLQFSDERIRQIQIKHLAAHTSGIPAPISSARCEDPEQHHKYLTFSDIFSMLETLTLAHEPGTQFDYQNTSIALIGYILCSIEGVTIEELLFENVFLPMGMHNTCFDVSNQQLPKLANAYIRPGVLVPNWEWGAAKASGGLRSTTEDMAIGLNKLFYENSQFSDAMRLATRVEFDSTHFNNTAMGLGWYIADYSGRTLIGHGGTVRGFKSVIQYDVDNQRGVVVLSNSANDIMDIAMYVLDRNINVKKYKAPKLNRVPERIFNAMQGRYMVEVNGIEDTLNLYSHSNAYFMYSCNINETELFYKKNNSFYVPNFNCTIEFDDLRNNTYHTMKSSGNITFIGKRL